jgi:NAD(P)-dependent dehydrogenase (short-subunit alcohol dehydrogenase family)
MNRLQCISIGQANLATTGKCCSTYTHSNRLGRLEDRHAAVAFLAGKDSRLITGQTIYVNGGTSMADALSSTTGHCSGC